MSKMFMAQSADGAAEPALL